MGTYIVISHDFDFLDKITDCILDIDYYTIKNIVENIHLFKTKKRLRTDYLRRYQKQQKHERLTSPITIIILDFKFKNLPLLTKQILKAANLTIGYHKPLLSKISFSLSAQEKLPLLDLTVLENQHLKNITR